MNLLTSKSDSYYYLFKHTVNNSDYKSCSHTTMSQQQVEKKVEGGLSQINMT